jgi:hypothetical protein
MASVKQLGAIVPAAALVGVLAVTGCDKKETQVRSYSAPKDTPATAPVAAAMDARPVGPAAAGQAAAQGQNQQLPLTWTLPTGWTQDPQPRPMRVATVNVDANGNKGELIVTRFRTGAFGSIVDNLNRWRQQVGLPPVKDEKEVTPEKATVGGAEAKVYDFTGPAAGGNAAKRNRVVVVETPGGDTWFFRFAGTADLVENQRGNFDALLQSVKFTS